MPTAIRAAAPLVVMVVPPYTSGAWPGLSTVRFWGATERPVRGARTDAGAKRRCRRPSGGGYEPCRRSDLSGLGGPLQIAVNAEDRNPRFTRFAGDLWPCGPFVRSRNRSTGRSAAQRAAARTINRRRRSTARSPPTHAPSSVRLDLELRLARTQPPLPDAVVRRGDGAFRLVADELPLDVRVVAVRVRVRHELAPEPAVRHRDRGHDRD